jgi:peroxiredoxin
MGMKRLLFILLLSPLTIIAQVTPATKGFLIEGKLDGYADGTQIRLYKNGESVEMASAKLLKGKFAIKGNVAEPVLTFLIVAEEKPVEIYLENAVVSFKGNKAQPGVYDISGSASHKDFAAFVTNFLPLAQQMNSLATTINQTMPGAERDGLMVTYNGTQQSIQKQIDKFITEKPKSPVAAFVLNATYQFNEDPLILEKRFNMLDASVKKLEAGKQLEDVIAEAKIGAIGSQAIDFTQADTTGTPVSLSSFRGKYVLVDFWASWCGPCRQENPNVVENFNKFSSKNFTVLGVSLDRPGQKNKWIEAIKTDNLTWTHVSDLQFWSNAAAQLYHVKGIPQNFLVDPNGVIVAKNLRGTDLEAKLCELLGCN